MSTQHYELYEILADLELIRDHEDELIRALTELIDSPDAANVPEHLRRVFRLAREAFKDSAARFLVTSHWMLNYKAPIVVAPLKALRRSRISSGASSTESAFEMHTPPVNGRPSIAVPFGPQPPWSRAARLLARAWPALVRAFTPVRAVRAAAIIGSYATGTPTSSSDLDVLVLVGGAEMPSYRIFLICDELESALNCEVNATIYSIREFVQLLRERDPQARHMACGALLIKGALPPGVPQRRARRAPPTRDGVIPLSRSVSDRKIANLLGTAELLLKDSHHPKLSEIGRVTAAVEALRHLVNAILEAKGYRHKGEDVDGVALEYAQRVLGNLPLDQLPEAYIGHMRGDPGRITSEKCDAILADAREFHERANAWLRAQRPRMVTADRPSPEGQAGACSQVFRSRRAVDGA